MNEKNFIPHTKPKWNLELPEGYANSLVDAHGTSHDDDYNFDERDYEEPETSEDSSFNILAREREFAEQVKDKVFYAGLFVDREELYKNAPAHLENTIEKPHVTTNFAPDETQLHLDELGSDAKIFAIGYGNNGKNEGLLVRVEADDPAIQKAVDTIKVPHITLSFSNDSHPKYTSDLDFSPLEHPFELDGTYCLHMKDDSLVDNIKELNSV